MKAIMKVKLMKSISKIDELLHLRDFIHLRMRKPTAKAGVFSPPLQSVNDVNTFLEKVSETMIVLSLFKENVANFNVFLIAPNVKKKFIFLNLLTPKKASENGVITRINAFYRFTANTNYSIIYYSTQYKIPVNRLNRLTNLLTFSFLGVITTISKIFSFRCKKVFDRVIDRVFDSLRINTFSQLRRATIYFVSRQPKAIKPFIIFFHPLGANQKNQIKGGML